jgi:predicted nucleic acid-binding Zn ribbon protein
MIAVQRVLPDMLAEIVRRQPLSPAKVDFAWRTSVGPALARATTAELRKDGTLVVRLQDARWKAELNRGRGILRERLGVLLGDDLQRIVIHAPSEQQ